MKTSVPVLETVDVLVLGGSTGAVQAALSAAAAGAHVLLVTSFTYPGEDVCSHMRYWLDAGQQPTSPLASTLFAETLRTGIPPTPMHIKYTLEQSLVRAGIRFLYMSYPAWLLRDDNGALAGAVIANRSGFQAVVAPVIVDATGRALAGRMTQATFRPFPSGAYTFERTVLGGSALTISGATATVQSRPMTVADRQIQAVTYRLSLSMPDASPASFSAAETRARLLTWHPDQATASERLFFLPPDRLQTNHPAASGTDVPVEACRCGADALFLLSTCADLTDDAARSLARPCNLMSLGDKLGRHAVGLTRVAHKPSAVTVDHRDLPPAATGDVCRKDSYFRLDGAPALDVDLGRVPVLADFDVVVAGGGTGGAPAGIASARAGARTAILEYQSGLGGIATEGRIASYYYGNRCGFTTEIDKGVHAMGPKPEFEASAGRWNTEWKKQYFLSEAVRNGASVWFGTTSVAAAVAGNRVCGVLAMMPWGFGLVKAAVVVDSSGSADVAAAAGASMVTISRAHAAMQGSGLPPFIPGRHYTNTDHTFIDDNDIFDVSRAFVVAREKFKSEFDLAQIADTRERRQIVGDISLDPLDFLANRTFPDTVVTAQSNFDSHGFTVHPLFMAKPPDHESTLRAHVPFRCLLPRGLENIIVTGLGVCSHRDALPVIRMISDVQNQGYAAGRAAAVAARGRTALRRIDIKELQKHLVEIGNLAAEVLNHGDSFPLSGGDITRAVREGMDQYLGLAVVFAHADRSRPLLQQAWRAATDEHLRLRYAHVLGLMGDATGADTLFEELQRREWDKGWAYKGMGQFGFSLSEVDTLLVALARTGNPGIVTVLRKQIAALTPESEFSHFRAVAIACENCRSPELAPLVATLLDNPAIAGNSKPDLAAALRDVPAGATDNSERNRELKELHLARALFACGDRNGKGRRVLEAYARDLHGLYARHARAVLEDQQARHTVSTG